MTRAWLLTRPVLLLTLLGAVAVHAAGERGRIDGRIVPSVVMRDLALLATSTRVVLNDGEYVGFVREDGSFSINNVPTGTYMVDVVNADYTFDKLRIDYSAQEKSKPRVTLANLGTEDMLASPPLSYPLRLEAKLMTEYFAKREGWNVMSVLSNPMLITMVVTFGMAYILPKLTEGMDPEALKEMQQQQTELLSVFSGGSSKTASSSTTVAKKDAKNK